MMEMQSRSFVIIRHNRCRFPQTSITIGNTRYYMIYLSRPFVNSPRFSQVLRKKGRKRGEETEYPQNKTLTNVIIPTHTQNTQKVDLRIRNA